MNYMKMITEYVERTCPIVLKQPFKGVRGNHFHNIKTAEKLLVDSTALFEKEGMPYLTIFGTLLGIYRSGKLIPYDSDLDFAIRSEDAPRLVDIFPVFEKEGIKIIRVTEDVVSLARGGEYFDIYIFSPINEDWCRCHIWHLENRDFASPSDIIFQGATLKTVREPEEFLRRYYGDDWQTPKKDAHAGEWNPNG